MNQRRPGLFDPTYEHANCGVGVLVDLKGEKRHSLVAQGLDLLANLDHRGARGAEEATGDGAGMMLQVPHAFFRDLLPDLGEAGSYGVGQLFLPRDGAKRDALRERIEEVIENANFEIIAWRDVPTDNIGLGETALRTEPAVVQLFVKPREVLASETFDAQLYILRHKIERVETEDAFYICSLDRRRIVYKGLLTCHQLRSYYPDLSDERVTSSLTLVHARFSTNTLGAWKLAHPYRTIVHNGEINTLRGNLNWMRAREAVLESARLGDMQAFTPLVPEGSSDTAALDSVLELLIAAGRDLPHALRLLVPEAWQKDETMSPERRAFYDYHATLMEPWDGPALIAVTDGSRVAAVLDRNGLRPCRYLVTKSGTLIMASEAGVLQTPPGEVEFKGRLEPGQMFLADTTEGRIVPEAEIFGALTNEKYARWLKENRVKLSDLIGEEKVEGEDLSTETLRHLQRAFGYTLEQLRYLLTPMAKGGKDPIGAMGSDTPPAALSSRDKPLSSYFTQLFAQVSNPPLDYLRESLVTSLESHVGKQLNLLDETPAHCRRLLLDSPILTFREIEVIKKLEQDGLRACTLDLTYEVGVSLERAIEEVRQHAVQAVQDGCELLILSDRALSAERVAIPSLLAVGAVHHHLIRRGLRTHAGVILESGEPRTVHDFCTLLGYGADAVHPWLAFSSIAGMTGKALAPDAATALERYKGALEDGVLKVMSKMGISTLESYKGAQVFQAIGLDFDLIENYFEGTTAHVEGVGLALLERDLLARHEAAFDASVATGTGLEQGGDLYWRRDGELHQWNPLTIGKLQHAVRTDDAAAYRTFADFINEQDTRLQTLAGLLEFNTLAEPLSLDEVEPCEDIMKRFATGSMSFGSLSQEAHESLAIAMNRIGGTSGTGEGGEPSERFGTERSCSMKQVASGRFGVTIDYLVNAQQIEIKMAQGSKPGEGGELPGEKVDDTIAEVRFTTPGVGLISPPPHHDIYSIEDLAQLIHDLKNANPKAEVHVKLVAKAGVGTIAAGVAKARADAILISGDSGGTGASLKTSIKSAGAPWELGLAEAHQTLLATRLRSRVRLRADGGLKTGRDVVVAALLGAEQYGFGTAPLVALGCVMLRKCHCNTCSVGVATQDPELRKRFAGKPEHVVRYMRFVAQEVRGYMAALGFRTVDEMVGRVDKLRQKEVTHPKGTRFNLSQLLYQQPSQDAPRKTCEQNHKLDKKLDLDLIEGAQPTLESGEPVTLHHKVRNSDRTVGTMLSSTVAKRLGGSTLEDDTIKVTLSGSAGQSFGAFLAKGITLHLTGEANDYVGKGLSGGKIIVETPSEVSYIPHENVLIGNVALYGATRGEVYINGMAGERFAVRNSGVLSVVEGVGDHGCEYMTGGVVVVLGATGKNFAAGMSGGEAFVWDETGDFATQVNTERVSLEPLQSERDIEMVRRLLENHASYTNSSKASEVLDALDEGQNKFVKVMPEAYAEAVARLEGEGKQVLPDAPPPPQQRQAQPQMQHQTQQGQQEENA